MEKDKLTHFARALWKGLGEEELKMRAKVFSHLSATVLAILFVLALSQAELHGLKGVVIDGLYRTQWWKSPHPDITLISYDDDSAVPYEGLTKLPTEELTRIFDVLAQDKPLAVAVLTNLNERTYEESELNQLATAFAKVPNTFVGYTDDDSLGRGAPPLLARSVRYAPGFVSRDTFSYGADSVTRRAMIEIEGIPTVYSRLAALHMKQALTSPIPSFLKRYERHNGSLQTYIRWQGPSGTYVPYSSQNVANGKVKPGTFSGKIVLISTALQSKKGEDHIFTPFSREHFDTTRLEGAAQSLATLLRDNGVMRISPLLNFLISLILGIITVNLVIYFPPGRGIFLVVSEIGLLLLAGWVALFGFGYWINITHPIVIACVSYYLVIPYRLVDEYRKRWHYQEKSELMAQLEKLKSNFLSLVSHDLKTPLARIQGNAELALTGTAKNAEVRDKLDAIIQTTEDLSQYVETVLDITRIESSRVPLQKQTKDINATIQEIIERKRPMASEKGIEIAMELDPLFSIKYDVKLIGQVIANLLENAIKYSPDGRTITLRSREEGDWVRVSVIDEGPGISSDEQEKVFEKFYRVKNSTTDTVKGSGLGLYLVKYFVELHNGFVELKSEVGKGSAFTISLPV